ncbi:hypothetical protein [Nocardia sp. CNY236]|uniref:hypothetical protein n=1 Tax=Nocardia sp. CNY236 TaxID=1169152 RepID=UPI00048D194C|nr:hypothetical protein [Nocardia sp. CNY236]
MARTHEFAVGDHVVLDGTGNPLHDGKVFGITKTNPKTLQLEPLDGGTAVRADRPLARPATDAEVMNAKTFAAAAPAPLVLGSVVKVLGRPGLYVVVEVPTGRSDLFDVSVLGGDQNRYLRCDRASLTLVAPESLRVT